MQFMVCSKKYFTHCCYPKMNKIYMLYIYIVSSLYLDMAQLNKIVMNEENNEDFMNDYNDYKGE